MQNQNDTLTGKQHLTYLPTYLKDQTHIYVFSVLRIKHSIIKIWLQKSKPSNFKRWSFRIINNTPAAIRFLKTWMETPKSQNNTTKEIISSAAAQFKTQGSINTQKLTWQMCKINRNATKQHVCFDTQHNNIFCSKHTMQNRKLQLRHANDFKWKSDSPKEGPLDSIHPVIKKTTYISDWLTYLPNSTQLQQTNKCWRWRNNDNRTEHQI